MATSSSFSSSLGCLAGLLSPDLPFYAGNPRLLSGEEFSQKIAAFLLSERAEQLTLRVALHAQLRRAFSDPHIQARLLPFINIHNSNNNNNKEEKEKEEAPLEKYIKDAKSRARFFPALRKALLRDVLSSKEHLQLKEVHSRIAAWEKENSLLLLYYQMNNNNNHNNHNESHNSNNQLDLSSVLLIKELLLRGSFEQGLEGADAKEKFLEGQYAAYTQLRQEAAYLLEDLQKSSPLERLGRFIRLEEEICEQFGLLRLLSRCRRKDQELSEPNEGGGGVLSMQNKFPDPADVEDGNDDEEIKIEIKKNLEEASLSRRAAQYALPRIIELCYANYRSIYARESGEDDDDDDDDVLKDPAAFRYWFLACLTADCPGMGPNTVLGRAAARLGDYKKHFFPRRGGYAPSINPSHRSHFARKVAERRGLPHFIALVPCTYSYKDNRHHQSDLITTREEKLDLVIYDSTNKKVLLMIYPPPSRDEEGTTTASSGGEFSPSLSSTSFFLTAREERYRLAALLRSALFSANEQHHFTATGSAAEFFFDPDEGPEENFYCIMAPLRLRAKSRTSYKIPLEAFRPFTTCPPRYFVFSNSHCDLMSTTTPPPPPTINSRGRGRNPHAPHNVLEDCGYPLNFSHLFLNEAAMRLMPVLPVDYVEERILPLLKAPAREGRRGGEKTNPQGSQALRPTEGLPEGSFVLSWSAPQSSPTEGNEEMDSLDEKPLRHAFDELREWLFQRRGGWQCSTLAQERAEKAELKGVLPPPSSSFSSSAMLEKEKAGGHRVRTPLEVFESLLVEKKNPHDDDQKDASGAFNAVQPQQQQQQPPRRFSDISTNRMMGPKTTQKVTNAMHL